MKKSTLLNKCIFVFLLLLTSFISLDINAQSDFNNVISGASTSGNGRAPQGAHRANRSVFLLTASEMSAAGFVNGDIINGIGFTYSVAQDITTTGTIVVYMQNTSDATNTKSTTWATAITGMTTASNGAITIPNTVGDFNYSFTGGTPFTYTGNAVYVAFDYQNLTNPLSTANTALCNTALTNGLLGAFSTTTTIPTTTTASNFRPQTRLAKAVSCSRPTNLSVNLAATTTNSATVSWNPIGGSNVDIKYGPYGFNVATAGTQFTNVTSPYVISGLSPSTVYHFYVRTNCGTSYSAWAGPFAFNTTFQPVNTPYNTGFEQEQLPFLGWSTPNPTFVSGDWATGNYGAGPLVQEGVYSVASITPATTDANNWMFSRGINLTSGSNVTVSFYISNYQSSTTKSGVYELKVGNAPNTGAQTTLIFDEPGFTGSPFVLKSYNFTPTFTGPHYFGFRNKTTANATGTHAIIIDNFTVTQALSINEQSIYNITVYPNPANNEITVSSNANIKIDTIELSDLKGRSIKTIQVNNMSDFQINISDLSSGIYLLNINSLEGKTIKKFVKN